MYSEFSTPWFMLRLLTSVFTFTYKRVTFSVIKREINFLLLVIAANISTKKIKKKYFYQGNHKNFNNISKGNFPRSARIILLMSFVF